MQISKCKIGNKIGEDKHTIASSSSNQRRLKQHQISRKEWDHGLVNQPAIGRPSIKSMK